MINSLKLTVLVLVFASVNLKAALSQNDVKTNFIQQKIDNFDPRNGKMWSMKYLSNDYYHKPGGPIIIDVGGQHAIKEGNLISGHLVDIAKEVKGYLFNTEHRYYGESTVTNNLRTENLKYLSMRQAIEDLKNFITHIKETIPGLSSSKVILKGHSYSGGLVVWFKHIYPGLIDGVWSSSPKLLAQMGVNSVETVVGIAIKLVGGTPCYDAIKNGVSHLFDTALTSIGELKRLLNLCLEFDGYADEWNLFYMISNAIVDVVTRHSPINREINKLCVQFLSPGSHANGIVNFFKSVFHTEPCVDATIATVVDKRSVIAITNPDKVEDRLITYQQCNEFGWFPVPTDKVSASFLKFPELLYYYGLCSAIFGLDAFFGTTSEKVSETMNFFKSFPLQAENVLITHGSLDPWKTIGQLQNIATEIINYVGHGLDLGSICEEDTPEMLSAKNKIKSSICKWTGVTS